MLHTIMEVIIKINVTLFVLYLLGQLVQWAAAG